MDSTKTDPVVCCLQNAQYREAPLIRISHRPRLDVVADPDFVQNVTAVSTPTAENRLSRFTAFSPTGARTK